MLSETPGIQLTVEIIQRILLLPVQEHFVMQMGSEGSTTVAGTPDNISTSDCLTFTDQQVRQVGIHRLITVPMVYDYTGTLQFLGSLHILDFAVSGGADFHAHRGDHIETAVKDDFLIERMHLTAQRSPDVTQREICNRQNRRYPGKRVAVHSIQRFHHLGYQPVAIVQAILQTADTSCCMGNDGLTENRVRHIVQGCGIRQ